MESKKIHFMGVGGAGCSAAFAFAKNAGFAVSGCDRESDSPYLDPSLKKYTTSGHSISHLSNIDLLVYSPAIPALDNENQEFNFALEKGIASIPWDQFVADFLLQDKFVIAVSGTHGKGTVTAMLATCLELAGKDPSCLVGAVVSSWKKNYRVGKSNIFVIEADEYSKKLLRFFPDLAIITNIDFDHPEMFKDTNDIKNLFTLFVKNLTKGSTLITGPDVNIQNPNGDTVVVDKPIEYDIKMIGEFNKLNAALVAKTLEKIGIQPSNIKNYLQQFTGVNRRFEFVGEANGVMVFDDYAHHPTAIEKTLLETRLKFPHKKIWCVYQPHLYSRTQVLFDDFVSVFSKAKIDNIFLLDIFEAREKENNEIESLDIVKKINKKNVSYAENFEIATNIITKNVKKGDIVITIGAGDIYKLPRKILKDLRGTKDG